jgi:hypothetical protein
VLVALAPCRRAPKCSFGCPRRSHNAFFTRVSERLPTSNYRAWGRHTLSSPTAGFLVRDPECEAFCSGMRKRRNAGSRTELGAISPASSRPRVEDSHNVGHDSMRAVLGALVDPSHLLRMSSMAEQFLTRSAPVRDIVIYSVPSERRSSSAGDEHQPPHYCHQHCGATAGQERDRVSDHLSAGWPELIPHLYRNCRPSARARFFLIARV